MLNMHGINQIIAIVFILKNRNYVVGSYCNTVDVPVVIITITNGRGRCRSGNSMEKIMRFSLSFISLGCNKIVLE